MAGMQGDARGARKYAPATSGAPSRFGRLGVALGLLGLLAGCQEVLLASDPAPRLDPAVETRPGVIYSLPKALLPVTVTRAESPDTPSGYAISLAFGPPIIFPDQAYTFTLAYQIDGMSSDAVSVRTSGDGLLESISTTSRDERAAVAGGVVALAGEIAKAAATLAAPVGPVAGAPLPGLQLEVAPPPLRPFSITLLVDPYDPDLNVKLTEALIGLDVDGVSLSLVDAAFPGERRPPEEIRAFCESGACYRRAAPVALVVTDAATQTSMTRTTILPNNGVVGRIDFERRAFVENRASALFDQGMLVEVAYDDPSSAAAAANAPVNLVRDIVSIPAAALGASRNRLDEERALLEAEERLLRQRAALLQAQQDYQAAVGAASP